MGSLIDELQRREAAARAEAEELRGRIAELAERLARAEERLSLLVIARETVEEVLGSAATEMAPVSRGCGAAGRDGADGGRVVHRWSGWWRCRRGGLVLGFACCRRITGICWRWLKMPGVRCGRARSPWRPGCPRTGGRWRRCGRS